MATFSLVIEPRADSDPAAVAALAIELARILETANRAVERGGGPCVCATCRGVGRDVGICSDCYGSGQRR